MKWDSVQWQNHEISRAALHIQTLASFSQLCLPDRDTKGKEMKRQWPVLEKAREKPWMNKILCKKEKAGWDGRRKKIRKKRFKDIYSSGGWAEQRWAVSIKIKRKKNIPSTEIGIKRLKYNDIKSWRVVISLARNKWKIILQAWRNLHG